MVVRHEDGEMASRATRAPDFEGERALGACTQIGSVTVHPLVSTARTFDEREDDAADEGVRVQLGLGCSSGSEREETISIVRGIIVCDGSLLGSISTNDMPFSMTISLTSFASSAEATTPSSVSSRPSQTAPPSTLPSSATSADKRSTPLLSWQVFDMAASRLPRPPGKSTALEARIALS